MVGRLVSPVIVGRAPELEAATRALDGALGGTPVHLLVAGEAGVGKSRFVAEVSEAATARGMRVLRGECANVGDGGLAYAPIVEALRELSRSLPPDELDEVVGPSGPDLVRLVPSLARPGADLPIQQEWLQARLLEALLGLLHRLAAREPVVFVIEDLHWADAASRETVAFLVRNVRADRLLLVITYRSDELHRRHPLLPWLAELERTGRSERIDLGRLDREDIASLVGAIRGTDPDPRLTDRIYRRSDGNPFFAEELLAADAEGTGRRGLTEGLREVLLARLAAASDQAHPVISAAAVIGRRVDHDLLAAVVGGSEDGLDEGLRGAVASQVLIAERLDGADGYAFRHALLQEAAYDDLLPGERRRLHRACAEALAARDVGEGAEGAAHWAQLAHHWDRARDEEQSFRASVRAAVEADRAYAFAVALQQYEHALELWGSLADPESLAGQDRAEILSRAARAANLSGDQPRHVALCREAIAAVDPGAHPVRAAVLREQLGRAYWVSSQTAEALAAYQDAMAIMPVDSPSAEQARVLSGYGQMLMLLDRWSESREVCRRAVEIAQRVGAREAEGHARNTLGLDLVPVGPCEDARRELETALEIALEVGNADDLGRALVNLTEALFHCGWPEEAAATVEEGVRVAERYGISSSYGAFLRHGGIVMNFELGNWARAHELARESFQVAQGGAHINRYGLSRWAPLSVASGDFELAATQLEALSELLEGKPVEGQFSVHYHAARAELALWQGRPADALAEAERGLARMAGAEWPWYLLRLHRFAARAAADLAVLGRDRRDPALTAKATARAEANAVARAEIVAAALASPQRALAREALVEGAIAEAEDTRLRGSPDPAAWRLARERWTEHRRPYPAAYAGWREAEALLETGDRAEATAALRRSLATARELGARPLAEALESLARRARIAPDATPSPDPAGPARGPRTPGDPYGLTRRELEVLGLVALGRTNRQIADTLFISENTAGVHVSNILGKLGVASRTEAAALAVRAGYAAPEPVADGT